jgi:signal transduction histidine kinase
MPDSPSSSAPSAEEIIASQTREIESLRENVLDHEDTLRHLESQHDVLESFCFGLEQEHEKARRALETTKTELQASYDKLRALSDEQDDILAHVKQGILTIGRELTINPGYSRITESMFERSPLAGIPFESLFVGDPSMRARIRRYVELCFAELYASPQVLERLNPAKECPFVVRRANGETTTKLFSFSFARIKQGRDEAARAPVTKLMVVVDDRTAEYELNRELARRTKEHAAKVEKAYRLVMLPPDVVRDFISEAAQAIDQIERDGVTHTPRAMQVAHSLKGNARALGLDDLATATHVVEEVLGLRETGEPFRAALANVKREVADGEQLFQRMVGVRAALRTSVEERAHGIETTLRNLVAREADGSDKQIDFEFATDLPKGLSPRLLLRIKNALVQLVRNAIAHGVERAPDRIEAGKSPSARIEVSIRQEGAMLVVQCRDDGRGIDTERLRAAAVARGQIARDAAEKLDDAAAMRLVFATGVSTQSTVDELSGRGVGMDVVKDSVESSGGEVSVTSEAQRYTLFVLRFPHEEGDTPHAPRVASNERLESGGGERTALP